MSRRSKALLLALVIGVYALVPWRWASSARTHDLRAARADDAARAALTVRIGHARAVAKDKAGWANRVHATAAAFPPTTDVAGALSALRTLGTAAGVQFLSLSASPAVATTPALAPVPIQIQIRTSGSPASVEAFLNSLRASPRLVTTTALSVTRTADILIVQLTGQLWVMATKVPA